MSYFVKSYSDYIKNYIKDYNLSKYPGEHHFVATYLLPLIMEITDFDLPDYINPDGMKDIPGGDLVWYRKDKKYNFGIEVKFLNAKLSKKEFNNWITEPNIEKRPHLFIGISEKGIILLRWNDFIEIYKKSTEIRKAEFKINNNYGPACNIDKLFKEKQNGKYEKFKYGFFEYSENEDDKKFIKLFKILKKEILTK